MKLIFRKGGVKMKGELIEELQDAVKYNHINMNDIDSLKNMSRGMVKGSGCGCDC